MPDNPSGAVPNLSRVLGTNMPYVSGFIIATKTPVGDTVPDSSDHELRDSDYEDMRGFFTEVRNVGTWREDDLLPPGIKILSGSSWTVEITDAPYDSTALAANTALTADTVFPNGVRVPNTTPAGTTTVPKSPTVGELRSYAKIGYSTKRHPDTPVEEWLEPGCVLAATVPLAMVHIRAADTYDDIELRLVFP